MLPPASTTVLQASLDLLDAALLLADGGVFPPGQGALQVCAAVDVFCRCASGLTAGHHLAPPSAVHACKPKFHLGPPSAGVGSELQLLAGCWQLCDSVGVDSWQAMLAQRPGFAARLARQAAGALNKLSVALRLPEERRPAWADWQTASVAAQILSSNSLGPALESMVASSSQAGSSERAGERSVLHAAVQLAGLAPLECSAGMQLEALAELHIALAGVLSAAVRCRGAAALAPLKISMSRAERQLHAQHAGMLQRQLSAQLRTALPRLSDSLQLLLGGSDSSSSSLLQHPGQARLAARLCGAWLPCISLAGQLTEPRPDVGSHSARSSSSSPSTSSSIEEMRQWDWHGSKRYGVAGPSISTLADVAAWCEAAAAALRALPQVGQAAALAAEHGAEQQGQGANREQPAAEHGSVQLQAQQAPAQLAERCVLLAVGVACSAVHAVGRIPLGGAYSGELDLSGGSQSGAAGSGQQPAAAAPSAASLQAAQLSVWSLHTAAACLAHWAAQPSSGGGGGSSGSGVHEAAGLRGSWAGLPLLRLLNATLAAARLLQSQLKRRPAADPELQYDRWAGWECTKGGGRDHTGAEQMAGWAAVRPCHAGLSGAMVRNGWWGAILGQLGDGEQQQVADGQHARQIQHGMHAPVRPACCRQLP